MQKQQENPRQEKGVRWRSPWEEFKEEIKAETRARNERCNELGLAFRALQQEAINQWCAWEQSMEVQEEETT